MSGKPPSIAGIDNRIVAKVADLSAPLIGKLPVALEEHRRVILLLGLGCTQDQTAKITDYSHIRVQQLASIYKKHIKAVALERDLCVVGVLDQAIGMAGDRLNQCLENVDLSKPNTADIMRLANSIESLRRTAYDLRSSSLHGDKPGKQVQRPTAITLESLDAAMSKAKQLKEGGKDAIETGKADGIVQEYVGPNALGETAQAGDGKDGEGNGEVESASENGDAHDETQVTAVDTDGQNAERETEEQP